MAEAVQVPFPQSPLTDEGLKRRIEALARKGKASQALDALKPDKLAPTSNPEVMEALQKVHPSAHDDVKYNDLNQFCPRDPDGRPLPEYFNKSNLVGTIYTRNDILLAIRKMKRHAAPGLSGWTQELFVPLLKDSTAAIQDFLVTYINQYMSLELPGLSQHFSSNSFLFAFWKVEAAKTVRPIAIPCFLNKLAWKIGLANTKGDPSPWRCRRRSLTAKSASRRT